MLGSNRHSGSLNEIIEYIFVILTILQCNSVYMYFSNHLEFVILKGLIVGGWQLILIMSVFYFALVNHNINKNKFYTFIMIYAIILILIMIFYYFYYTVPVKYFLLLVFDPILLIILFYNYFSDKDNKINLSFFYKFENIIFILALISLICYFLYSIGIRIPLNISYKWGGDIRTSLAGYFGLWYAVTPGAQMLGISLPVRNSGIFTEAPVFAYILSVTIFINLFLRFRSYNSYERFKLVTLFIALFLTQSLNGIIISTAALFFKEILQNKNIITKILFIILVPVFLTFGKILFVAKRNAGGGINSSYNVRSDDILASLHAWTQHIFIGNGIGNNTAIQRYMDPLRLTQKGDLGITSNIFLVLAFGGLILFIIYVLPFILSVCLPKNITYFALFNLLYFIVEGTMNYYIFVLIMAFMWSSYLLIQFNLKNISRSNPNRVKEERYS